MSDSVERVRAALIAAGHPDTILMFPDGTRTAQDAADAVGCTVAQIAKSVVLRAGEQPVLVIASGSNRVDLTKIAARLGQAVKPADGRWVRDTIGFAIGGVSPVSHDKALRIFIDADLMALDPVWTAAGTPRHVFRTTPAELARMTGGDVADVKEDG
ncbi:MAG TPA: YbaK/EbsC family protein [Pseudolabrys sp.]|nr:YbaK/EbsC family protein [Pseudolabrys sp.]